MNLFYTVIKKTHLFHPICFWLERKINDNSYLAAGGSFSSFIDRSVPVRSLVIKGLTCFNFKQ